MSEKLYSWRYVKNNVGIYTRDDPRYDGTIFVTINNPNRNNSKTTLYIEGLIEIASNEAWETFKYKKIHEAPKNDIFWDALIDKVNN